MSSQGKLEQLMGSCFVLQRRESWGSIKEIVGGCYGRSRRSVWDLKGRDWWVAVERRIEVWEDLGRFGWLCWRFRCCEEFVRGQLIICGVTEVDTSTFRKFTIIAPRVVMAHIWPVLPVGRCCPMILKLRIYQLCLLAWIAYFHYCTCFVVKQQARLIAAVVGVCQN